MNNFSKTDALKRAKAARQAMSDAEDMAISRGAEADPDNPPLTEPLLKRGRGRPALAPEARKQKVNIMLDPDIVSYFKSGGKGWQTRINASLRDVVKRAERKSG
ncbi:MAG: BrnA antitoxin family protein [Pseudomonadota bacterium]